MKTQKQRNLIILLIIFLLSSCSYSKKNVIDNRRVITDAIGRIVSIPDSVDRIVCIRPGTLHLVSIAGGKDKIVGVEDVETSNKEYIHCNAYPELRERTIIGPHMGGDAEQILTVNPDVVFTNSTTIGEADELQTRLGIPVIALDGGDMNRHRPQLYKSLDVIGNVINTKVKTDSLKSFIDRQIFKLSRFENLKSPKVYIGGISYRGARDITATDPYYAPFQYIGANNVAQNIDSTLISAISGTFIDKEELIAWNPDYIFIDRAGKDLAMNNFIKDIALKTCLRAYNKSDIFILWPYNNYHSNYEVMLINAWAVAKALYPKETSDIDLNDVINEILYAFYGKYISKKQINLWGMAGEKMIIDLKKN